MEGKTQLDVTKVFKAIAMILSNRYPSVKITLKEVRRRDEEKSA